MKRKKLFLWLALLVIAASAMMILRSRTGGVAAQNKENEHGHSRNADTPMLLQSAKSDPVMTPKAAGRALAEAFFALTRAQSSTDGPEEGVNTLKRTTEFFLGLPASESAVAIIEELESGRDSPTGIEFAVGEEGLAGAPTWRVYLLDLLGCIDPRAAAEYARKYVFPTASSPDEWAVSLRNVMLSYPSRQQNAARQEVGARLREMLLRGEWRASPSRGMLEALDFLAHTTSPAALVPILQKWLGEETKTRPDLAVQISLERSAVTRPHDLLPALAADASLLGGSPGQRALRASLMARADLGDAVQASAVLTYLQTLDPASEESIAFFRCFPERRFAVSPGLASQPHIPTADALMAGNTSALSVLSAWLLDPRLAGHSSSIQSLMEKVRDLR